MNNALLENERVRLVALSTEDAPTLARWTQSSEYMRLLDARPAVSSTEASLADWIDSSSKSSTAFLFGVRRQDDDTLIGYVELEGILWSHGSAWLAIAIGQASDRGQGYGAAALGLALGFAFRELNLHRVQLTVFSYNEAAIRLYEKLGFVREGAHREMIHRDGQRYDMLLYGILRREWDSVMSR